MEEFTDLINDASAEIEATFAERMKLFPRSGKAQYGSQADPERSPSEFTAILRHGNQKIKPLAKGWDINIASSEPTLTIIRDANPDLALRVGDLVRALDRDGLPDFEIASLFCPRESIVNCRLYSS